MYERQIMTVTVTPYTLTAAAMNTFAAHDAIAGLTELLGNNDPMITATETQRIDLSHYEPRPSIEIDDPARSDEECAEDAFVTYQNISRDRVTPDGKRSMMVGDLVAIDRDQTRSWYKTMAMGFKKIEVADA